MPENDVDILLLAEAVTAPATLAADINRAGELTRVLWDCRASLAGYAHSPATPPVGWYQPSMIPT